NARIGRLNRSTAANLWKDRDAFCRPMSGQAGVPRDQAGKPRRPSRLSGRERRGGDARWALSRFGGPDVRLHADPFVRGRGGGPRPACRRSLWRGRPVRFRRAAAIPSRRRGLAGMSGGRNYWLVKSEPSAWSWDQMVAAGRGGTGWTGVRNHLAKQQMMAMKKGDLAFFY